MELKNIIKELVSEDGISGFESGFAKTLSEKLKPYCDSVEINRHNSVTGKITSSNKDAKTILIDAHLDKIGLIVTSVDDNGFVGFSTLGGVDERILPASEVYVLGKEKLFGVIGAIPPHLTNKTDKKDNSSIKISDMLIDTGLSNGKAKKLISVGDPVLLKSSFSELLSGRISSAALDNRAGIASVFEFLEKIKSKNLNYNIIISFTSGEELGLHGAYTVTDKTLPDLAICVDVTHGSTPDTKDEMTFPLGCGAVICRGPNLHYEITKKIIDIATEKNIPYEIEVAPGSSGTNAWAFQTTKSGIPCALISIPLRYMHSSVEVAELSDIEAVSTLLSEIVSGGDLFA